MDGMEASEMEGVRVFVPDDARVWVPATVLSVEPNGKRFMVRLDPILPADDAQGQGQGRSQATAATSYDDSQQRMVDLTKPGMPDTLPLQNCASDFHGNASQQARFDQYGAEDMCALNHLHEPAIVYNLRKRFLAHQPYTYTGQIVVSVNPYQWHKALYSEQLRDLYMQKPSQHDQLPPHVYATSARAFTQLQNHGIAQSILVSGESGAGKTETVKILMEHLASISMHNVQQRKQKPTKDPTKDKQQGHQHIVQKVLKSNPLLESFGNAKTIRNDNSSRFGKFTQLQFDAQNCLIGAKCRHYLLEKSRVVAQSKGERNYHVFYQLLSAKESKYGFDRSTKPRDFRYLQDEVLLLDGKNDAERYQMTRDALTTIGVTQSEQEELFSALCGILRLGQLDFVPGETEKDDSSQLVAQLDPDDLDEPTESGGITPETVRQQQHELELCAKSFGVDATALSHQLCSRTVKARQEVYCVPLSTSQASNNRDALAKEIYARLFATLVDRVNCSISDDTNTTKHIDLLDIFGFESFETNRFEQFCINFANEKLQQKFTQDIFKTVQEEYTRENVQWQFIKFRDNQDMLDLLEGSMGVIALLNEECVRPMGSDASFASKIVSLHESNPRLEKTRLSQMHFMLHHYAGRVTYDAHGFVEKNKDALQTDLMELLCSSDNMMVAEMFSILNDSSNDSTGSRLFGSEEMVGGASQGSHDDARRSSAYGRKTGTFMQDTVSYKFKTQLTLLMNDISSTEVRYIRCIKPNESKSANVFDLTSVVSQLRCAGMVEAIRITRAAFPNKMSHERFLRRFVIMRKPGSKRMSVCSSGSTVMVSSACTRLAEELFMNGLPMASEDDQESDDSTPIFVVGKTLIFFGKGALEFLEAQRTTLLKARALVIQRVVRRWCAIQRLKKIIFLVLKMQSLARQRRCRTEYLRKRNQCITVQSIWRAKQARRAYKLRYQHKMATRIQCVYRGYNARKRFYKFREAIIRIQAKKKMRKQVDKYQQLLEEKKQREEMENEMNSLKIRLEEEKKARIAEEEEMLDADFGEEAKLAAQQADEWAAAGGNIPDLKNSYRYSFMRYRNNSSFNYAGIDEGKLLDDSERMIDYLKKEVTKSRDLIEALTQENEHLKMENKKVKDAYTAAGASFAALNQHNKQQSKANLRLMSTHAALIKSQEEKMKKYQKQIADLKEDLNLQRNVYAQELTARVQQQELLIQLVRLAESNGVPEDVLDQMRDMVVESKNSIAQAQAQAQAQIQAQTEAQAQEQEQTQAQAQAQVQPTPAPPMVHAALNSRPPSGFRSSFSKPPPFMTRSSSENTHNPNGPHTRSIHHALSHGALDLAHQSRRGDSWEGVQRSGSGGIYVENDALRRDSRGYVTAIEMSGSHNSGSDYMDPTYESSPVDRSSWVSSSRSSFFSSGHADDETRHRKSRISGMFKKMFKKDEKERMRSQESLH